LIDGSGAPARQNVVVRIADGAVVAVEPDSGETGSGAVIDARELTVLPGLVDARAHLLASGACTPGTGAGVGQAVRNLHALVRGGVTTVADLGAPVGLAVALRRHAGTARSRGPRVLVSGPLITAPGGHPTELIGPDSAAIGAVREVGDNFEARNAVRDIADADADFIGVALHERSSNGNRLPLLDKDVLCAVVDEAHLQEMRVVAHATTVRAYEAALDCGVDAIAHGSLEPLPEALIERLVESELPVAPTQFRIEAPLWGPKRAVEVDDQQVSDAVLADLEAYAVQAARNGERLPPHVTAGLDRTAAEASVALLAENTRRMAEAGVLLGLGTGAASCFHLAGSPIRDLERLEAAGIEPLEILKIASVGGARLLDLQDAVGRIAVGYRADLIGVRGQPDQTLADIEAVELVMIDGVRQRLDGPTFGQHIAAAARVGWTWLTE
jgi:imidazolonepropionase-like amidohydrolase